MKREIFSTLMIIATVLCSIVSRSCANTQTPPSGGDKDTIPPVLVEVNPPNMTTQFPTTRGKVILTFNEYTVIKSQSDIYFSPIPKKRPTVKVRNKNIEVTFNDTLATNTTYTIDFGKALADNNEGNPFPRYVYSFSTGNEIDSMYFTGTVLDSEKLLPVKDVLVALYTDEADSVCILQQPVAATKTDEWGYFVLRNIKPVPYRVYAFTDKDGDSKYMIGNEKIAFIDSLYTPTKVVSDDVYELGVFDMKDTLECQKRVSDIELRLFQEYSSKQYIKNKGRINKTLGFITFAAKDAVVNSFKIYGVDSTQVVTQFSPQRDSMCFWINEKGLLPDSLMVSINYLKTDSLNQLVATNETVSLAMTKEDLAKSLTPEALEAAKADTTFTLKAEFKNTNVEQDGIKYTFPAPLIEIDLDKIVMTKTNPRNQVDTIPFTFTPDSLDKCAFVIQAKDPYQLGDKYELILNSHSFQDVFGRFNNEIKSNFTLPTDDKLSTITINFTNVNTRYLIELVNKERTQCLRKYSITEDTSLFFPYVSSGTYCLRITEDRNGNGVFDSGDMLKKIPPEKVSIFKLDDGSELFFVPEQTDIIQDIKL